MDTTATEHLSEGKARERGQALVEMAIVLPLFLFLLLIAADLGRLFATQIAVTNAAREGAFYAVQHPSDGGVGATAAARQEAPGSTVTVRYCSAGDATCPAVTALTVVVSVSKPFAFLTPFITSGFGQFWSGFGALTVQASASGEPL
jgi:Flp pilus assembly protein TadG